MQSTNRDAQKPHRQERSTTELHGHPLKLNHRPDTCSSMRSTTSRMMKSSIMVSSPSSPRRMNNAPGEFGSCAASPNDVHHRCRSIPRPPRRTAARNSPISGDRSDIMFHLKSRLPWKVLHASHWTIGNQTAPFYWPSQRYQHRDAGRYYTFGQCAWTLAECAELHSRRTPNAESKCRGRTHKYVYSASGKRPMCSYPT